MFGKGKNSGYRKEEPALWFAFGSTTVIMSSEENLEDQFRTLTELVNSLKVYNQRFSGGERSSTSSDSVQVPLYCQF